jgi:hypothetical protein
MFVGLVATALTMLAADINGKWTATMQGRNGQSREVTYTFTGEGAATKGVVTAQQGERPLENLKVDGDNISWSQTMNFGGQSRTMNYEGKISGDSIKVKMKAGEMEREFEMKRAK